MKRLMCLSFLLCLGVGLFSVRGFATEAINVWDLGGSAKALGEASDNKWGGVAASDAAAWAVGSSSDAPLTSGTLVSAADDKTVAIGSTAAPSGSLDSPMQFGNLVIDVASGSDNAFDSLLIGGINSTFTAASGTGNLHDFVKGTATVGSEFSASFGRIFSAVDGASNALQVLVGNKAEYIKIADLTAKTAAVQGDLATGNALELTKLTLVGGGSGVSSKAIDGGSTLTLGNVVWTGTASDNVGFTVESNGANIGKIVFSDDFTFGRNEETITFVSDSGTGNARAEIVANKSLTLDNFRTTTADSAGVNIVTSNGQGKISVGEGLTINLAGNATLANVDVDAKGTATITGPAAGATLTLGDTFNANGITINAGAAALTTVNVKSMKSGAMGQATGTPGDPDYVAPAFTASTITVNGAASGVKLVGVASTTGDNGEVIEASMLRVLSTAAASTANEITDLTVAADLVVGSAESVGNLTVTASNLRNLTQNRGITTFSGAVAVDGMTTISGKDSVNNGRVIVSAGSTFGAGITVNTGGVLQGAGGAIAVRVSAMRLIEEFAGFSR